MGRRSVKEIDAEKARQIVGRHFRKLVTHGGVNLAELRAQMAAEEIVDMLVSFTRDDEMTPEFRRKCGLDVILIAFGPMTTPWVRDGKVVDVHEPSPIGGTMGDAISAARLSAQIYQQLDDLVRRRVPPGEWPPEVREAAGSALAFYEGEAEPGV